LPCTQPEEACAQAKVPSQVRPEVTSALKSSEVDTSLLVPEFVSPAPVIQLFTESGDFGVSVFDCAGLASPTEDAAHVTGLYACYVHYDGFTLGAFDVQYQVTAAQQ